MHGTRFHRHQKYTVSTNNRESTSEREHVHRTKVSAYTYITISNGTILYNNTISNGKVLEISIHFDPINSSDHT